LSRRTILTARLKFEPITWADCDRMAVLHADARVMDLLKHGVLNRQQSDTVIADYEAEWSAFGFGSWTVTERASGSLVGYGGLRVHDGGLGIALRAAFAPEAQGKGYGPELGHTAATYAFDVAKIDRVIAITRQSNIPGQRSLEKFGMHREREWTTDDGRTLVLYALRNPKAG
jgi:RimJ/RimL family protein N-acetyltransferase